MIIAHHLVWTAYGWWLPNDPRGSGSHTVRADVLADLGEIHYGRKRVQPPSRDIQAFYTHAALRLKHPLLTFDASDLTAIGEHIGHSIRRHGYTCWAAVAMTDHVHLVIRMHRDRAEAMIEYLQADSAERLRACGLRDEQHPVWARGGWKVFLDTPDDVRRTIRYVRQNPVKIGLPVQEYDWVEKYDGWPHVGRR